MNKLPDAEFEVMSILWGNEPPITTAMVMEQLGNGKGWRLQTAITLLNRMEERGFVRSEKKGKERTFYPLVEKAAYLRYETDHFLKQYHGDSFVSLVAALDGGNKLTDSDVEELAAWLKKREVQHE